MVRLGKSFLVGCSILALVLGSGPLQAQQAGIVPARSASTAGLFAARDFETAEYLADYGLAQMNASTAYARGYTGQGILVAVYDSGIDAAHPEFAGRISAASRNFFSGTNLPINAQFIGDGNGHGTHVSGTIGAARDGQGTMGVAFDSTNLTLYTIASAGLKAIVPDVQGNGPAAIDYARLQGARVFNGSYGPTFPTRFLTDGVTPNPEYEVLKVQPFISPNAQTEYAAVKRAVDAGMLLVFAAGNERQDQPTITVNPTGAALYPFIRPSNAGSGVYLFGNADGVVDQSGIDFSGVAGSIVAVVAVDRNNTIAPYSNWCGVAADWCLASAGSDVVSTYPLGTGQAYAALSGTSMATPHVTGAAAVLMQAFPFLTAPQIAQTLFTTATPIGPREIYGWGLLNLGKAIDGPGQFTSTWNVDTQGYYGRFANDISGIGGLIKTGAGTLELAGRNSYLGGTTINGGTLSVSRDANLGAASGGLALGGGTLQVTADGFASARAVTLNASGTFQIDTGRSTLSGVIANGAAGAGSLTKTGAGTLALAAANTFTGATNVAAGTLALAGAGSLAASSGVQVGGSFDVSGVAGAATAVRTLAGTGSVLLGGTTLTVSNGSTAFSGAIGGTGGLRLAGGSLALTGASTYAGATTVTGGATLLAGSSAALGNGGAANILVLDNGKLVALGEIASPASRAVTLAGAGTLDTNGNAISLAGAISGAGALTKAGAGTLTLSGQGSFAGGATVSAGTLALTAAGTLASRVAVSAPGQLMSAGTLSGGLTNLGVAALTGGRVDGGIINGGTLTSAAAIAGGLTNLGVATLTGGRVDGGITNSGALTSAVEITGGLTNSGSATLNAGRVDGGLINSGTLASSVAVSGGLTNSSVATLGAGRVDGGVVNSGALTSASAIANGLVNSGAATLTAGRVDGGVTNTGSVTVTGTVASDGTFGNATGAVLQVTGTGAYSLGGLLTNAGSVTVASGGSLSALGGIANTGFLDLGGGPIVTNALNGSNPNAVLTGVRLSVGQDGSSSSYSGSIVDGSGVSSLTKVGSGTLTLAGASTYTGPTTISGGVLSVNGSITSPVSVESAGTLRGTGFIAAPVTVAGVLAPGNSPGTLVVAGPVGFAAGSTFSLDIDGAGTGTGAGNYARLFAVGPTGIVTAGGTIQPVLRGITGSATNTFAPALGQRFGVLATASGLTGSFAGIAQPASGLPAGSRFDALYGPAALDLVVTPASYGNLAANGLASSGNARAVGAAVDQARPLAGVRPDAARQGFYDALYTASPALLGGGLASLSGQSYGDALLSDLAARRLLSETIDRHLTLGGGGVSLRAGESGGKTANPVFDLRQDAGGESRRLAIGEGRVWADGIYGFGNRGGDRNASGARFDVGGVVAGIDRQVGADTLVGGAFSYLRNVGSSGQGASAFEPGRFATDSFAGTLYGTTRFGDVELRGQAEAGYTGSRVDRLSSLGSYVRRASGSPDGANAGGQAFLGYRIGTGLGFDAIPELGFAYDYLTRSGVAERGGTAISQGGIRTPDLVAARSLLGGRIASLPLGDAEEIRFDAKAYWAHELADTTALIRSDVFGAAFTTRTSRPGRDGAVLGMGVSGALAPGARLQLGYTGELRPGANAHAFTAGLNVTW